MVKIFWTSRKCFPSITGTDGHKLAAVMNGRFVSAVYCAALLTSASQRLFFGARLWNPCS